VNTLKSLLVVLFATAFATAAAAATLEGGTIKIKSGEQAKFPIAASGPPSDLRAQCRLSDVGGSASLIFDGEHYVPMSDLAVGEVVTLSRGDNREFNVSGVVDAAQGGAYLAFNFTGAAASMCFPGMPCDGAEDGATTVTVTCRDTSR